MNGQMNIFDTGKAIRPCDYSFKRYIGQRVKFKTYGHRISQIGRITAIDKYYTFVKLENGKTIIGTPTTIIPVEVTTR